MSAKKVALIVVMVCGVILFSSIHASAAYNWFTATVVSSTAGTTFQCKLTGTELGGGRTFTNKTFTLLDALKNQMLAVLLSAQSMGATVQVYVDPDVGTFPTLYAIGMLN